MNLDDVSKAVRTLIDKAQGSGESNDALKFSQAACNVANAGVCVHLNFGEKNTCAKENTT